MNVTRKFLPGSRSTAQDRRNIYDVTNTVNVGSVAAVRDAVRDLFMESYPGADFDVLWLAFHDFERLFTGNYQNYTGCDTVYHDIQHTLDMTLAMARLLCGYECSYEQEDRLGHERAVMGLIAALFHDAGYIRRADEAGTANGAEFTPWHVSRSAKFLSEYFPGIGMGNMASVAMEIVHFTGYELNLDEIELENPKDSVVGHLLGTADLLAQMADRCYLEKCRDRLYSEFVLAGIATEPASENDTSIRYQSGEDLLKQTPTFYQESALTRLESSFNRAYRYIEALYEGQNPYMDTINKNLAYLQQIIESQAWHALRRQPPCFTVKTDTLETVGSLVGQYLAREGEPGTGDRHARHRSCPG